MATYIGLINWTQQGVQNARDTLDRAAQARALVESMGGRMDTLYWTQGRYDIVAIIEAPDDETLAAMLLRVAGGGAVRSETMRAFDDAAMRRIVEKLG